MGFSDNILLWAGRTKTLWTQLHIKEAVRHSVVMTLMYKLVVLTLLLASFSCAGLTDVEIPTPSGNKGAPEQLATLSEQLATFKEGQTTYQEVVAKLGPPASTQALSDGSKFILYTNMGRVFTLVNISFDQKGILKRYTINESQVGVNGGLNNGRPQ